MGPVDRSGPTPEAIAAIEAVVDAARAEGRSPRPHDLGPAYESLLSDDARALGAHFTDPGLARALVDRAAPRAWLSAGARTVWDPACGGGAFLLAAADALVAAGHEPEVVVSQFLHGTDLDPGAVAVCAQALRWWARDHGAEREVDLHLEVGDTLLDETIGADGPFDLVVGNPPFQGQLVGATVRGRSGLDALRARWGEVAAAYTDTASLFLVAGARALAPGGRLCLVLPLSTLAARDAEPARRAVEDVAHLAGLWVAAESVFEADVEVCAPVLRRRGGTVAVGAPVERWRGRAVEAVPGADVAPARRPAGGARRVSEHAVADGEATWAVHALAALGVPDPNVRFGGRLGELVRTAAGFRDEYYGLVGHVEEAPASVDGFGPDDARWPAHLAALATSGAIDVGCTTWGARPVRFAGVRFDRPVVDRRRPPTSARAAAWLRGAAEPKVVVATQTRVGEAAVDAQGHLLPSTPVVAVFTPVERLWDVAAVVCSPVGSVAALARTAGTGRSARTVRHSGASVAALPLPVDDGAWARGASALRSGDLVAFVDAMADAYDVDPADRVGLAAWWRANAPSRPA